MFRTIKQILNSKARHRESGAAPTGPLLFATVLTLGVLAPRVAQAQIIDVATFTGSGATGTGNGPTVSVTFDSSGNLYGTAQQGGLDNDGTVWEIPTSGGSYGALTVLGSFTGTSASGNGSNPGSTVAFDSAGNIYGTTSDNDATGYGGVWEMTRNVGGTYGPITDLASFTAATSGAYPYGSVVMDSAGNLYGTTTEGGATGNGTVWELAKGSSAITAIASFTGANGSDSLSGVVFDSAGDMFGTSSEGGANNDGAVWEIVKGSGAVTELVSFTGTGAGGNGAFPDNSGVALDSSGNLYGTTAYGGTGTYGTVYEIPKVGGAYGGLVTLGSFSLAATGGRPIGGPAVDSAGDLFGTTSLGGTSSDGTVWELAAGSGTISDIGNFNGNNGSEADATVSIDSAGDVLGTTEAGGFSVGTVWEIKGVASAGGVGAASAPEPGALALLLPGIVSAMPVIRRKFRSRS